MELLTSKKLLFIALSAITISIYSQEDVVKAFKESYRYEKNVDYKNSIEVLKSVYQSDSYELNLRLGWLNYMAGDIKESINYYSKSIELKPYAIEPKFGLVNPLSVQARWDEILNIYLKIVEIDPQNTIANYRIGLIYYNRAKYDKSEIYLEKVVNLYPFDYDGLMLFAWNKLKLQKMKEAKVLFNKVLMSNPDDKSALEGLSYIK